MWKRNAYHNNAIDRARQKAIRHRSTRDARHYALCLELYSPCPSLFPLFPLRWSNYPTLSDSRISLVALNPTHLFFGVAGLRLLRPLCAAFCYQATASQNARWISSKKMQLWLKLKPGQILCGSSLDLTSPNSHWKAALVFEYYSQRSKHLQTIWG